MTNPIPQLVNVPTIADPDNFDPEADDLLSNQLPAVIDAMNAVAIAMNLNATSDTSVSSNTIASSGDITFTVSAGKSFLPGQSLAIVDTAAPTTNGMFGQVKSYSGTTLVFTAKQGYGSGTKNAWVISQSINWTAFIVGFTLSGLMNLAVGANIASAATINLSTATGNTVHVTGTVAVSAVTMNRGQWMEVIYDAACPLTYHTTNHKLNTGGQSYTCSAGDSVYYFYDGTTVYGFISKADGTATIQRNVPVRQTVLSGPVDSNGLPNFGGSTGSTTVTMTGTLTPTAANGFDANGAVNRIGQIVNASWTGLSTNGTMYLGLTINADGTCTPFSTTLAPVYQWGGAYSNTNNQRTFNIQEMMMKVGSGAAAAQAYDVFVGQVTVAAGVVSAITWYALMGRYDSGYTNTLPGTATVTSFNHNIGVDPDDKVLKVRNITTEAGYVAGEVIDAMSVGASGAFYRYNLTSNATAISFTTGSASAFAAQNKTTGIGATLTAANWAYRVTARRGW